MVARRTPMLRRRTSAVVTAASTIALTLTAVVGSQLPAAATAPNVISTVAGGSVIPGPAPAVGVTQSPFAVRVVGPFVYVADSTIIRRIDTSLPGNPEIVVAGNGAPKNLGDGGPATAASFELIWDIAFGPGGRLYVSSGNRVRMILPGADGVVNGGPDETISTVVGTGANVSAGDGGAATLASLRVGRGIALDADGNLYVAEAFGMRVRKVTPPDHIVDGGADEQITTIAGTGTPGSDGDGMAAKDATLLGPFGLDVVTEMRGGSPIQVLYVTTQFDARVRKITPGADGMINRSADDLITLVAADIGPVALLDHDAAGSLYVAVTGGQGSSIVEKVVPGSPTATVSVLAGTSGVNGQGFAGDGGVATAAKLSDPRGVALDGAGNLLIADGGNHRLRRVNASDSVIGTIAGNGLVNFFGDGGLALGAQLGTDARIALDTDGNVYVADSANQRVRRITAGPDKALHGDLDENIITVAGNGSTAVSGDGGPATAAGLNLSIQAGIALDGSNNLYVYGGGRIRKVVTGASDTTVDGDADELISTVAGGGVATTDGPATAASILGVLGMKVSASGLLFLSESAGAVQRVRAVNLTGGPLTAFGVSIPAGNIVTVAGTGARCGGGACGDGGAATAATLGAPADVALDAFGNLLIADRGARRIRKVDPNGTITSIAGTGDEGPAGDGGPASAAAFGDLQSLTIDRAQRLVIGDGIRVRQITGGIITTIAGGGAPLDSIGDGGAATSARLNATAGLAVDIEGGVLVDTPTGSTGNRIRRVAPPVAAPTRLFVAADFNGDRRSDLAVFRPSTGVWYANGTATPWGAPGDIPVPGDYDGYGASDLAVFRPSESVWYVNGTATQWGAPGDIPVPGDYDGNGTTDFAVFRPSTGVWYVNGTATQWGAPGDIPVPGDYDGNGTTDFAVFRPSESVWYVNGTGTQWGASDDIPVTLPAAIRTRFFS